MALDPAQQDDDEQKKQQEEAAKQLQQPVAAQPTPTPVAKPAQTIAATPKPQPIAQPVATPQPVQQFGTPAQQLQQPAASTRTRTPTPISSYQRLQDYLRSGQTQAQGLGGAVQQNITNQATAGRQALGTAAQSFNKQVEAAGLTRNADRTSQLIAKAAGLNKGEKLSDEELAEIKKIASTQQGFAGLAPADLTAISQYATALGAAEGATEKAALTGSESGRQALLSDIYGANKPYTSGQSLLDQALVGSSQAPATQLAATRKSLVTENQLNNEVTAAEQAAATTRSAKSKEVNDAVTDVTSALGMEHGQGALGGLEQMILDRTKNEQQRVTDTNALIDQATKDGGFNNFGWSDAQQKLITQLGMTQEDINNVKTTGGLKEDLFNKLKDVSAQTVTSQDDYAKLNALYKIADMYNRTAEQLPVSEQDDLGALISQKSGLDMNKVKAAQAEVNNLVQLKQNEIAGNLSTVKVPDYRFGRDMDVPAASRDIVARMTDGDFQVSDNSEADKILAEYDKQLGTLNQFKQSYGLPAMSTSDLSDAAVLPIMEKMILNMPMGNPALRYLYGRTYTMENMPTDNPELYAAIKEQAKRIQSLEYYNKLFNVGTPEWRR